MLDNNTDPTRPVDALQNGTPASLTQGLFDKAQRDWGQKHPNKPMAWSYWNPIFRKAGIPGVEGLAVYYKAYPPTQSKPKEATSTKDQQNYTPLIVDKARTEYELYGHGVASRKIVADYALERGANMSDVRGAWAERPETPGKLYRTFYLNHEMGHAIIAMHEGIPIVGIGYDGGPGGESGFHASSLILDWGRLGIPCEKGTPAEFVTTMTTPLEIL